MVGYLGVGVFDHSIWAPTEPAVAGVVQNMVAHDQLAVPRINDFAYLEKPPLYYWLAWFASKAGGSLEAGWIRLPATVLGLLSLAVVYWISRRRFGDAVAGALVLLAASSGVFYLMSHSAGADSAAMFFAFLCYALFIDTLPDERGNPPHLNLRQRDLVFALALAASFYAKNFLTFLLVLPPVVAYLLSRRDYRRAARIVLAVGLFTVLLCLPWVWALHRAGGWEYVRVVFFDNTLGRFLTIHHFGGLQRTVLDDAFTVHKNQPPYYYLGVLLTLTAPWSLVFVGSVVALFRKRRAGELRFFLKLSLLIVVLGLSLSASKSDNYLDGLLLVALLIMGDFLRDLFLQPRTATGWQRTVLALNLGLVAVGFLALAIYGWRHFHSPLILLWGLLSLATAAWLAWRVTRRARAEHVVAAWMGWATTAWISAVALAIPYAEAQKSAAPFFQQVAQDATHRRVYTEFVDDRRLPLISYYLHRDMPLLSRDADVLGLLRSPHPVGVIVDPDFVARQRVALGSLSLKRLPWSDRLLYLANRPPVARQTVNPARRRRDQS